MTADWPPNVNGTRPIRPPARGAGDVWMGIRDPADKPRQHILRFEGEDSDPITGEPIPPIRMSTSPTFLELDVDMSNTCEPSDTPVSVHAHRTG